MHQMFWLDPRDKNALLVAVARELAGPESCIVLECQLSESEFAGLAASEAKLSGVHRQAPEAPRMLVYRLRTEDVPSLMQVLLVGGRAVHEISAIQIVRNGSVEFMAGDNFHRECVSVGPGISSTFLEKLVKSGVLRSFTPSDRTQSPIAGQAAKGRVR